MKYIISFFLLIHIHTAHAQTVNILTSGTKTSLRGLSVPDDNTVWASGSNGKVARSINSGNTWKWMTVKGFEKTDFRSIEAWDSSTAVIMAVDSPAYILKTTDGGNTWKTVYQNNTKGMFLDAMNFCDAQHGIVIGDPINDRFFLAQTTDGGNTWSEAAEKERPVADSGEACFASSSSNIILMKKGQKVFVSGGMSSHLYTDSKRLNIPIIQGTGTTGANSVSARNNKTMIIVGGDFNAKDSVTKNCVVTKNGGKSWSIPQIPPHGYRSCIQYIHGNAWLACGLSGVDITRDNGSTFTLLSTESFHVLRSSKRGNAIFFAGGNGRIAIFQ